MVFDNADEGYEMVEKFLPQGSNGDILITSRSSELLRITSKQNSIEVCEMEKKDAISLLLKSASIEVKQDGSQRLLADKIVSELGCIPLAIDQAGNYMHECDCGLDNYLDLYHNQCRELMSDSIFIFNGASNYGRSTYGTWDMSMKKIESRAMRDSDPAAKSAVTLYKYFAFLHHEDISESIFKNAAENYSEVVLDSEKENSLGLPLLSAFLDPKALFISEAGQWNQLEFLAGIGVLLSFSLIKSCNGLYSIHPLMHAWSRDRISRADVTSIYQQAAAMLSCSIKPVEHDNSYDSCVQIIPHIRALYAHANKLKLDIIHFDDECGRFAFAFHRTRNWVEAKELYKCMMEMRVTKLGSDHPSIPTIKHNLASTYRRDGELKMAETLELEVLDAREKSLGENDIDTLGSMHSLALIYQKQGRTDDAEKLQLEVWERRKAVLGAEHTDTLSTMHNLAVVYFNQGKIREAEELQLEALKGRRGKLGADHPDTLSTMSNLSLTYKKQGWMEKAERLQMEVLNGRMAKLRADHPDIPSTKYNLALIYKEQGKMVEAEKLEQNVYDRRKEKLGADHPDTLSVMHNLAVSFFNQGKVEQARKLLLQVLDGRKVKLGENHPDTISTMQNLELTYKLTHGRPF